MRAGTLRHLVSIFRYTESIDSYGTPTRTYTEQGTAYADIKQTAAGEGKDAAKGYSADATFEIKIRGVDKNSINVKDRIVFDSINYEITAVNNVSLRNIEIILDAKVEVTNA